MAKAYSRVLPGATMLERLESKIARCPMSGCWIWMGSVDGCGYGTLTIAGETIKAHRLSWETLVSPIPSNAHVLHRCDLPCCVCPHHLFLGTHAQNMADRDAKGRNAVFIGENHPRAKLTETAIRTIRNDTRPNPVIASDFGVTPNMISRIKTRKAWTHI